MSYMYAYMSQPKHQLETFKAWAGKSSDISYYLNSHHVDFCEWACFGTARPVKVVAMVHVVHATREGTKGVLFLWVNMAPGVIVNARPWKN
jgi:D-galacturonate reductase